VINRGQRWAGCRWGGDGLGWELESWKHIRDRSCLLRCSLLLKARLQNWHLYFLSGAEEALRGAGVDAAEGGMTATLAAGILSTVSRCSAETVMWTQGDKMAMALGSGWLALAER